MSGHSRAGAGARASNAGAWTAAVDQIRTTSASVDARTARDDQGDALERQP
jgi:hypothetical protein